ncbi:MAG TPA: LacI family DNA-binding transcriptional regulator [Sphingomicrobium sp.]|nr:LacI family DNA-binding transcriptional regulator [Sphingomicrobium sp.]
MTRRSIDDVAALAGVSIKTVSRVLNDEPGVRPATRERVEQAIRTLNYRPSLAARSLAGKHSSLIGLLYENPSANYVFDLQSGAIARCRESDQHLFIQSCNDLGDRMIDEVLAMVEQTHVDGLVVTAPLSANHRLIAALDQRDILFVRVAPDDLDHRSPSVEMDDRAAAAEMTRHLVELGHRRIAFILGHPAHYSSRLRFAGFNSAVAESGLDPSQQSFEQGFNTTDSGLEAGLRLLDRPDRPTAIFASNDDMAAGAILAAHRLGLDVPRDISITGFDDSQLASVVWPPLTTIHQPTYDMCYTATGLLIDLIKGSRVESRILCSHRMVVRHSTAPPRRPE